MVKTIKTHLNLLKALHSLKPKHSQVLLKACDSDEINCICECIYNVLRGNIPLKDEDKLKLRKHKKVLRRLVSESKHKSRKRAIVQEGGAFLPIILGTVLSGLLSSLMPK